MLVTLQQVYNGLTKYVENEIAKKSVGLNKFMAYFLLPAIPNKTNEILNKYKAFFEPYIDSNGNIMLDELYNACSQAMQRSVQVEWNNFVFKQEDIDMLYRMIKE